MAVLYSAKGHIRSFYILRHKCYVAMMQSHFEFQTKVTWHEISVCVHIHVTTRARFRRFRDITDSTIAASDHPKSGK